MVARSISLFLYHPSYLFVFFICWTCHRTNMDSKSNGRNYVRFIIHTKPYRERRTTHFLPRYILSTVFLLVRLSTPYLFCYTKLSVNDIERGFQCYICSGEPISYRVPSSNNINLFISFICVWHFEVIVGCVSRAVSRKADISHFVFLGVTTAWMNRVTTDRCCRRCIGSCCPCSQSCCHSVSCCFSTEACEWTRNTSSA